MAGLDDRATFVAAADNLDPEVAHTCVGSLGASGTGVVLSVVGQLQHPQAEIDGCLQQPEVAADRLSRLAVIRKAWSPTSLLARTSKAEVALRSRGSDSRSVLIGDLDALETEAA